MKRLALLYFLFLAFIQTVTSQTVAINFDKTSSRQRYAGQRIENALKEKGYKLSFAPAEFQIDLSLQAQLGSESFSIKKEKQTINITGGDERGLIYGCLSLVEDIGNGISLNNCKTKNEKPFLAFRAIKYDLPWDTYRHSYALELHDQTCRDTSYWKAFLDMMVLNRFNTLTLWNLHPYTFLIRPKNFPEASPWNEAEMKEWQQLFHSIINMATERAIETYIIPFNIFVTPEFAKAHNVAMDNLSHEYFVNGDTSESLKNIPVNALRKCLKNILA